MWIQKAPCPETEGNDPHNTKTTPIFQQKKRRDYSGNAKTILNLKRYCFASSWTERHDSILVMETKWSVLLHLEVIKASTRFHHLLTLVLQGTLTHHICNVSGAHGSIKRWWNLFDTSTDITGRSYMHVIGLHRAQLWLQRNCPWCHCRAQLFESFQNI